MSKNGYLEDEEIVIEVCADCNSESKWMNDDVCKACRENIKKAAKAAGKAMLDYLANKTDDEMALTVVEQLEVLKAYCRENKITAVECDQGFLKANLKAQLTKVALIYAVRLEKAVTKRDKRIEGLQESFRMSQDLLKANVAEAVKKEQDRILTIIHEAWAVGLSPDKATAFIKKYGDEPAKVVDIIEQALKQGVEE